MRPPFFIHAVLWAVGQQDCAHIMGKTRLHKIRDGQLAPQPTHDGQHRLRFGGMTFHLLHLAQIKSFAEWTAKSSDRQRDKVALNTLLRDKATPGLEKQHRRCEYIIKYGRTLFSCPNCWLLPGLCVCKHMRTFNCPTRVYVHVHHSEWAKSSNTGTVAALSLPEHSQVLLKGHAPHEARLTELFQDQSITTAVLWPGDHSILPSELKRIADEKTGGRVAVVAVDATWDAACRMKSSYPDNVLYVKLGPDSTLRNQSKSLLFPVRKYRGDIDSNGRVSTLEAIAYLLHELNGDDEMLEGLLHNLKIKVDAMLVQKLRPPVYGTVASTFHQQGLDAAARMADEHLAQHGTDTPLLAQAELEAINKEMMGGD